MCKLSSIFIGFLIRQKMLSDKFWRISNEKNVHIVPHMHWDREWYFSTEESRILLVNNMEEIMDMLENNHNYPYYVMDGQTILEDYLAVKPECKERVKN